MLTAPSLLTLLKILHAIETGPGAHATWISFQYDNSLNSGTGGFNSKDNSHLPSEITKNRHVDTRRYSSTLLIWFPVSSYLGSMLNTFAQDWIMSLEDEGSIVLYRLSDLPMNTSTIRQYVSISRPSSFGHYQLYRYSNLRNVLPVYSSVQSIYGIIVRFGQQEEGVDFLYPSLLSLYFADGFNGCVELWNVSMDTKGMYSLLPT